MNESCKLTPARHKKLVAMMKAGNFMGTAAQACGIHVNTLRIWLTKGRDKLDDQGEVAEEGDPKFRQFAADFDAASAVGEVELVRVVKKGDWKGAAWILERRHPDRWRGKSSVEMSGPGGKPLETAVAPVILISVAGQEPAPWTFDKEPDGSTPA